MGYRGKFMMQTEDLHSIHIDYSQTVKPYHYVVANLLVKHCCAIDPLIIDIGSGVGHTLKRVKELLPKSRVIAADVDKKCLKITSNRVELENSIPIKDIEQLYEKHNYYDAIILSHVLEHTLRPADTVKKLVKMLRPGGILLLAVPNPVRPGVFVASLLKRNYVNKGHVYAWDRSHFINFLDNILGLDVVCYSSDYVELPFLKRWRPFRMLGLWLVKFFPWLSFSNIAVIKK